mgnify:CR=1 FL=1
MKMMAGTYLFKLMITKSLAQHIKIMKGIHSMRTGSILKIQQRDSKYLNGLKELRRTMYNRLSKIRLLLQGKEEMKAIVIPQTKILKTKTNFQTGCPRFLKKKRQTQEGKDLKETRFLKN